MGKRKPDLGKMSASLRRLLMALVSALALSVVCYFADSSPYAIGGEKSTAQWIERLSALLAGNEDGANDFVPDSVLLVNVAYDKQLVDYSVSPTPEAESSRVGRIDITDRRKLLDFLRVIKGADYRFVVLDIRFENDIPTDSVSRELFAEIRRMPRLLFARHGDGEISGDAPAEHSAYSDYYTTMSETSMVKYPLMNDDAASIPLEMYRQLHGGDMHRVAGAYFDGWRPAYGSLYLTFPVRVSGWMRREEISDQSAGQGSEEGGLLDSGNKLVNNYYNLGSELLAKDAGEVRGMARGKIIVVGDYVNDVHDTYAGDVPGPLINLNAYLALTAGRHRLNLFSGLLLFLIYAAISYALLARMDLFIDLKKGVKEIISRDKRFRPLLGLRRLDSTFTRVVVAFIGVSTLLSAIAVVVYLCGGGIYSVVIPSIYFTLLGLWIEKRKV